MFLVFRILFFERFRNFINISLYFKIKKKNWKIARNISKRLEIFFILYVVNIHSSFINVITLHTVQKNSTIKLSSRLKSIASSRKIPKTSFLGWFNIPCISRGPTTKSRKVQTAENGGTMRPGREDQSKRIEGARWESRQRRSLK